MNKITEAAKKEFHSNYQSETFENWLENMKRQGRYWGG